MAKKYYAVRNGNVIGIFTDWETCKESVHGYKGAEFKSFKTEKEALAYLNGENEQGDVAENGEGDAGNDVTLDETPNPPKGSAVAYVDGSYKAETEEFSYGAVLFVNGESLEFNGAYENPEVASMRNVAGELKGAMEMMSYCVKNGIKNLEIRHDYNGIAKWCTGEWQANEVGTVMYKEFCAKMKQKLNISFAKVKGHSGNKYNNRADALAKEALGIK